MKPNFLLNISLFSFLVFALTACSKIPQGDKITIRDQQQAASTTGQTFVVDTTASVIDFTGNGVGKNHPGRFKLASGTMTITNHHITGGRFTIDITSLQLKEQGKVFQTTLKSHLLGSDFFDAEKFKTATFEITKVEPYVAKSTDTSLVTGANYSVSGNFTLKDVTKNITLPARIENSDTTLKAHANFNLDRTQWQMNYGSNKSLGNRFISEIVHIELDIEAKKQ